MQSTTPANPAGQSERSLFELSREECISLLASSSFGRLAVTGSGEVPIIRPVNYVFDQRSQSVAFRTVPGSKFHSLARAVNAAFEIDGIDEATRTGWSVIIAGVTEEVRGETELRRLEELGLDTWPRGERTHWVRIRAWTVSGRRVTTGQEKNG